ncbi:hypothetical protein [Streptomyces sp. NPDC058434]|uniref:hypothetical protein n=1 Tax=Streptomyces sp. NPDC058434 TaxID=3346498 RepID=UPI00364CE34A
MRAGLHEPDEGRLVRLVATGERAVFEELYRAPFAGLPRDPAHGSAVPGGR